MGSGEIRTEQDDNRGGGEDSVQLALPARAENVAIVRHALTGLAAAMEMPPEGIANLKTIVTEACMNVVVHAYDGEEGPLEVTARREGGRLAIVVRDYGMGIRPDARLERESLRLGIPLIAALSESFEITGAPGRGTEVTMWLPLVMNGHGESTTQVVEALSEMRLRVPAGHLVAPVLTRVIGMFATRADFSVDRLSDAILLSDAISAHGPESFPDGTAQIDIGEEEGAFTVRLGPLESGQARALLEGMKIPELGASLVGLADEVTVEAGDAGEYLAMRIARP